MRKPLPVLVTLLSFLAGACADPPGGSAGFGQEPDPREVVWQAEREHGRGHPSTAATLSQLAGWYAARDRHDEAVPLLRRAAAIRGSTFGANHPDTAASLAELAWSLADRRPGAAMGTVQRAAEARRVRVATARSLRPEAAGGEPLPPAVPDLVSARQVAIGWRFAEQRPRQRAAMLDETFQAGQRSQANDVAAAVARVAARLAIGEGELAGLVRDWLALVERRDELDREVVEAASRPDQERSLSAEMRLRAEADEVAEKIVELNGRFASSFPSYRELANPQPAGVEEVQQLLAADEALLAYAVVRPEAVWGEEQVFLWALRRDHAEMARLDLAPGELERSVRELRLQLDPGRWTGADPPTFDAALAHRLYAKLLPVDPALLAGAKRLLVVPDGALQSLPFGVLVRREPAPGASHRELDWLARTWATTTLPSVSSLRVLRALRPPARGGDVPFRGIGDPILARQDGDATSRNVAVAALVATGLADPAEVRALPALPETADELKELARSLRAGEGSLLLGRQATEAAVKAGALDRARVIAFATHAGVAGELPGLAEPGLVLTPPAVATEADDGVLTASEVATLRFAADFVVLSACNTGAPDGTPGAVGLSGLAKAFLHAGGRSLLVSHWTVFSDAAQRLTTAMFGELARDPSLGRDEALRRAELALLDDAANPHLAHPSAWAPFVLVGDAAAAPTSLAAGGPR